MSGTRSSRPAQRWPDVMIGVLTLALLGGFGTLLLGQHRPAQVAQPQPVPAPVAIPASPGTVPEPAQVTPQPAPVAVAQQPAAQSPTTQSATTAPATTSGKTVTVPVQSAGATDKAATTAPAETKSPAAATQPTATSTQPGTAATSTDPATDPAPAQLAPVQPALAQTSEIPPVPKAPPVKPITPPVLPKPPVQTAPATATTVPSTPPTATTAPARTPVQAPTTPAIPATPAVPPRTSGAVATSASRTPLRSDYRISLGSFSTNGTVTTQTAAVNALGYQVHSIDLGNQYVAQVGPFADEASARQALADIQRAYPSALLYRPKVKTSETAGSSDNSTQNRGSVSSSATTADTTPDTATRRPAPGGPTYLQVGAFDRVESAQKLVGTLTDAGFAPTVNNPPDRKTTVMVGPYSGGALLRAETRLDNAGLDHFRVR